MKRYLILLAILVLAACSPPAPPERSHPLPLPPELTSQAAGPKATPVATLGGAPTRTPAATAPVVAVSTFTATPLDSKLATLYAQLEHAHMTLTAHAVSPVPNLSNTATAVVSPIPNLGSTATAVVTPPKKITTLPEIVPKTATNIIVVNVREKTNLRSEKSTNNAGKPIMKIHEPRIQFDAGEKLAVYDTVTFADGGEPYYEIYDSDGVVTVVLYVRARDVRQEGGASDGSGKLPFGVVYAQVLEKTNLRETNEKNKAGKPIMEIKEPRVQFQEGDIFYVYDNKIEADGADIYHEVYDPENKYKGVLYARAKDLKVGITPIEAPYPEEDLPVGVANILVTEKTNLRYEKSQNAAGKPIMEIKEPRVTLQPGRVLQVYAEIIIADAGVPYYRIWDPDGVVTIELYILAEDMEFYH
ncbi:MAG: hypothetical protein OEY93_04345 [Anaerolineae bacterium]|nr:hypothetical protein [Anaerolineae bacterium]